MTASPTDRDLRPALDDLKRPPALRPFVRRLKWTNFNSISSRDLEFGPPTFLIGRDPIAASLPEFREIRDAPETLTFYDFDVKKMKASATATGPRSSSRPLGSDGDDLVATIARLQKNRPDVKEPLNGSLGTILPDLIKVESPESPFQGDSCLRFSQGASKAKRVEETGEIRPRYELDENTRREFSAASMSDGTLRALGILTAAFQAADQTVPVRLVRIEEPEIGIHPAAAALVDPLEEVSLGYAQFIASTQNGDLLDEKALGTDVRLAAVDMIDGITYAGPIGWASRKALQDSLYSAGESPRTDQYVVDRHVGPRIPTDESSEPAKFAETTR